MNWNAARSWLGTVVRLALGAIWIWAAVPKLSSPRTFIEAVRAYDATPEWLSEAIAYGLPVLEFCLGVALIIGISVRIAAAASGVLFVVFLIGIIQAAARGLELSCGCFGGGGETLSTQYTLDILRDIGLLVLAVYLVLWSFTQLSLEQYLARHDAVEPLSPKKMRTPEGRRKYNSMLETKRKAARDRALYVNSSIAIVVLLVSFIGIGVQSNRAKIAGDLSATNASVSNGVVYGKKAAATVDVYEDFQCPHCRDFEQSAAATLDADVRANLAQVRFHPMAFLDSSANDDYSTRAANAALCASDISVDFFVKYHNYLFGKDSSGNEIQPGESGPGRTNAQLVAYGKTLGVPSKQKTTFAACVQGEQHKALVQALTAEASKRGVSSTPTVFVNGKKLGSVDLSSLKSAIAAADAKGPAPSPSPTGSATGSSPASATSSPSASASVSASPTGSATP
ncbi:MAG TPA: MauE/DoxX family redox-associated membrane protein [Jatrophihabitantaceae bacterium]|nr:MauE/DoxX family redox-associated membrane protein [Jatrophihabitantaceae bacterium]